MITDIHYFRRDVFTAVLFAQYTISKKNHSFFMSLLNNSYNLKHVSQYLGSDDKLNGTSSSKLF